MLEHLEAVGFTGAPRFLGIDERGREVLEYLDGTVPGSVFAMTDEQLVAAGRLLRAFHDATAGSELAADADVVCHTDLGPHNTVFAGGLPVALIDWDGVRPGRRIDDLADALWSYARVGEEGGPMDEQRRRIAILCDAYGVADHAAVVAELSAQLRRALGNHERAGRTAAAAVFRPWVRWLAAHEPELVGGGIARRA